MPPAIPLIPLVVCGPSGTGKSTLLTRLFKEFPESFGFSVSHTTRAPRAGEQPGSAYHFVTPDVFKKLIAEGAFIEHAVFSGNHYGTSAKAVEDVAKHGRRCILDIDSQGVKLLKANHEHLSPLYVFLSPPSFSELRTRLTGRGTETAESVAARLAAAQEEMAYARTGSFDVTIVNDDVERAYAKLRGLALGEKVEGDKLPEEEAQPSAV